jgi:hypothetical protein
MKRLLPLCLIAAIALPACSSVKREIGIGRNSPDEFAVVKRAPLTLPPDYTLRPPASEGAQSSTASTETARTAVLGSSSSKNVSPRVTGERALLDKIGVAKADPDIRAQIDRENGTIALKNKSVSDKLIFWKDDDAEAPDDAKVPASVVDPKAETSRLKKNVEEGKPVNDGTVPVIDQKQSTFDRLFK